MTSMHSGLQAPESEKAVLGALLNDGMQAMEYCYRLDAGMFHLTAHQMLFRELQNLASDGRDWNLTSLTETLRERKRLADVTGNQGVAYLAMLVDATPYARWNPSEHVERIMEAWRRRRGAEVCEVTGKYLHEGADAATALSGLQDRVLEILSDSQKQDDPLVMEHSLREYEAFAAEALNPERAQGLSFGHAGLDRWTAGMQPGEVTVVGARSGVGKSSLMCQAIAAICKDGGAVDCFSLEMERGKILRKLYAIEAGVEYRKLRKPHTANPAERNAVREAAFRIAEWPLRVHEDSGMPIDEIVARSRMSVRRNGCKLVCVDYAQIVVGEGKDDRLRVANVSSKLRRLAKDEGCHVMLLSQLRKVSHEQYSQPPTAGDLRETGQIENDAHVILLLHRPWDAERMRISFSADLLIPKFRDGETGAMQSAFDPRSLTFKHVEA